MPLLAYIVFSDLQFLFRQNLDEFVSASALGGLSIVFDWFFPIFEVSVSFERICQFFDYSRLLSITLDYPRLPSITLDYPRLLFHLLSIIILWVSPPFGDFWQSLDYLVCVLPFLTFFWWEAPQKECKWPRYALRTQSTSKSLQLSMVCLCWVNIWQTIELFSLRDLQWFNQTTANELMKQQLQQRKTHVCKKKAMFWVAPMFRGWQFFQNAWEFPRHAWNQLRNT